ncbi:MULTISPECIES: hypothetical protein [Planococcus]|uniref:hypothetical protein n=1 Tax=Planococcus TaxID=1372 RepID=UPI0012E0B374|nr:MULTISPECIES: hypothetical protein [Planococcus]
MKMYLRYIFLIVVISIAAIDTWGETSKTIMYVIALISTLALIIMEVREKSES